MNLTLQINMSPIRVQAGVAPGLRLDIFHLKVANHYQSHD